MSTTMLELAISMIFLYLMLSAASSAIQEIIANMFRWRAKTLEKGIAGLFQSEVFKNELYKLPLFQSLCSPNARGQLRRRPSYIPPSTFALAVLDLAAKKGISLPGAVTPQAVAPAGNANNLGTGGAAPIPPMDYTFARPADLLASLLLGAKDVEEQRKRLEGWFNDSMDRVSGWYKRTSHAWLWVIGGLLCLLVNADSISLANAFWHDQTLRAATVAAARKYVETPSNKPEKKTTLAGGVGAGQTGKPQPGSQDATRDKETGKAKTPTAGQPEDHSGSADGTTAPAGDEKEPFKRLDDVRDELNKAHIPLGWCYVPQGVQKAKCWPDHAAWQQSATGSKSSSSVSDYPSDANAGKTGTSGDNTDQQNDPRLLMPLTWKVWDWWALKVLGIALSALAISQGAPFWFDLLQKAVNLRLAGDAPDEKKKK